MSATTTKREALRRRHVERRDALLALARRLRVDLADDERDLLYQAAEEEWDDAIHIAAPDDPLRSLCGRYGRNLVDLPDRPEGGSGCWTCLAEAHELSAAHEGWTVSYRWRWWSRRKFVCGNVVLGEAEPAARYLRDIGAFSVRMERTTCRR